MRSVALILAGALIAFVTGCGSSGVGGSAPAPLPPPLGSPWLGFAKDFQHSAQSSVPAQTLSHIHWQTPVDLAPTYSHGALLAHYGSPIITPSNTVIVGVKTGASSFRVEAHSGSTGALIWQNPSDYTLPAHYWTPSYNPVITPQNRVYFPGSGGKLFFRDHPDNAQDTVQTAVFYGAINYNAAKSIYDASVIINTPVTVDDAGNAFFGFQVTGATPIGLASGIARLDASGNGTWVSASSAAHDAAITHVAMNSAPALSSDQKTLYVAVGNGTFGYLLALDSTTLATKSLVLLKDPMSGQNATIDDNSTASPTVAPNGDVFFGVLESTIPNHNTRGWLLHFDAALSAQMSPGSFGWDDTASLVPATAVPSYTGSSSYLLVTKYNNYGGIGTGDGVNKIAVLDPTATETDPISGIPVMKEVLTIAGVTPDPNFPGGVREWCINTAAVDPTEKAVFANSEDGNLYRWDLTSNTFTQRIALTSGIGEAYTPTVIGPDGQVYAVNNAMLFAVGQ